MKQAVVAICDNISGEALLLEEYICEFVPHAVITKYSSGKELLEAIDEDTFSYELVFLKVELQDEDGIEMARRIREYNSRVVLVFMAESEEYYRQAFDLFVYQYLLCPLNKVKVREIFERLGKLEKDSEKIIYFKYRSQIFTIKQNEVAYISSSLHTVNFHLVNGESVHCRGKLCDFQEQLANSTFLRCHQSFYVNMKEIMGMKADSFVLKDTVVPISRTYMKASQKAYREYLGNIEIK